MSGTVWPCTELSHKPHTNWSFGIYLLSPWESIVLLVIHVGEESTLACAFRMERGYVPGILFSFPPICEFAYFEVAFLKLPEQLPLTSAGSDRQNMEAHYIPVLFDLLPWDTTLLSVVWYH